MCNRLNGSVHPTSRRLFPMQVSTFQCYMRQRGLTRLPIWHLQRQVSCTMLAAPPRGLGPNGAGTLAHVPAYFCFLSFDGLTVDPLISWLVWSVDQLTLDQLTIDFPSKVHEIEKSSCIWRKFTILKKDCEFEKITILNFKEFKNNNKITDLEKCAHLKKIHEFLKQFTILKRKTKKMKKVKIKNRRKPSKQTHKNRKTRSNRKKRLKATRSLPKLKKTKTRLELLAGVPPYKAGPYVI